VIAAAAHEASVQLPSLGYLLFGAVALIVYPAVWRRVVRWASRKDASA
jgi:hypothetical protein